jgi:NTE family protein
MEYATEKKAVTFALVLGGGGARALAHISVLEVLDELGIKPSAIAGSSLGAAIGAVYASGMPAKEMRRYAVRLLQDRSNVLRRLMSVRAAPGLSGLLSNIGNPMLLDALAFCRSFLPPHSPERFEDLPIPLTVVTADLYGRSQVLLRSGPLLEAVAASLAIPGLLRPIELDGRVLVDGAAVNPLPFDCMRGVADVVVAIDTSIGPTEPRGIPDAWDALFSTIQMMGDAITAEKLKQGGPDLLVRPPVGGFRLLDFARASAILRVADQIKPEAREKLAVLLGLSDIAQAKTVIPAEAKREPGSRNAAPHT